MHVPVLLRETVESLAVRPGGVYVDGTLGRAGHACAVLARAGNGATLVGIDRDEQALRESAERLKAVAGARVELVHGRHGDLAALVRERGFDEVDGILLDLGVSSPQLDEAGRGCMAGPVVAGAVIFTDPERIPEGIHDSKQMTHEARMAVREKLLTEPSVLWAVGEVQADEIDRINILQATWKAMRLALAGLRQVQFALVDGNPVKGLPVPSLSVVKGDARSLSIGAASILAKTHRDLLMEKYAAEYPQYGFDVHKGYCTAAHIEAVKKYGPCPIHRF